MNILSTSGAEAENGNDRYPRKQSGSNSVNFGQKLIISKEAEGTRRMKQRTSSCLMQCLDHKFLGYDLKHNAQTNVISSTEVALDLPNVG